MLHAHLVYCPHDSKTLAMASRSCSRGMGRAGSRPCVDAAHTHRREDDHMRRLTIATSLAAVLFALGCEDEPATAPAAARPQFEISDAGHGMGTPGFYFLPPMLAAPTFTGTFVSGLTLEVEICVWNGTACCALIATFSTNTGTGSETVRVDTENEQYIVNWKTSQFRLDLAKTYRIRVLFGRTELGHADVDVVATGRERKSVNTAEFVPVVNGQTLPITFRIEDGAILALA